MISVMAYGASSTLQPYVVGGVAIKISDFSDCTLGYKVAKIDDSGAVIEYGVVSAGHCSLFRTGMNVYLRANNKLIGSIKIASSDGDIIYVPTSDAKGKILYIKEEGFIWKTYKPVNLTVLGYRAFNSITSGENVCMTGSTSGVLCGGIAKTESDAAYWVSVPGYNIFVLVSGDFVITNFVTNEGDSGAPLYKPYLEYNTAILFGHLSFGDSSHSYFIHPHSFPTTTRLYSFSIYSG
jgi:hypothetical protein